jgi:hypothetical protein
MNEVGDEQSKKKERVVGGDSPPNEVTPFRECNEVGGDSRGDYGGLSPSWRRL